MSFFMTPLTYLLTILAVLFGAVYIFYKKQFSYWNERNVPHTNPRFIFGDLDGIGKKSLLQVFLNIYRQRRNERYFGFWNFYKPSLMINDPELIKKVLVQDFNNFHGRGTYYNEKDDPLSAHIGAIEGSAWNNIRAKLSPTFTSGKMKAMFPILIEKGEHMEAILRELAAEDGTVEIKEIITRYATDVIASCAFGIETNSLSNPQAEFRVMGRKIVEPNLKIVLRNLISFSAPGLAKLLRLEVTPRDVAKFFLGIVRETMDYREQNNIKRNDFMQTIIQLKNQGYVDDVNDKDNMKNDPFTFEQAAAQAFVFYLAGFETSSSALQFGLYELAKNQDVQDRLRSEIMKGLEKTGGKMTYENIHEMNYLKMVLDETLRLYSPAGFLVRECSSDYKLPGTNVIIEKGVSVMVPALGLHTDEKYYPDPLKFDPERFSDDEKASRNNYLYLPFGEGPRFCIGQRFALMQMRAAIVSLLSNFRVDLCEKSPKVIEFDPTCIAPAVKGGMYLKISPL